MSVIASDGDVSLSQGVMFSSALGSFLFVCLLRKHYSTDFHKIRWKTVILWYNPDDVTLGV